MMTSDSVVLANSETQGDAKLSVWDICVAVVPVITVTPMMIGQAFRLWSAPETKLGVFFWLFVLAIVAIRARGRITRHIVRMNAALAVYWIGCICLGWGLVNWSTNWVQFSGSFFMVAWALGRCSQRHWHEIVSWGLLFALTIPSSIVHQDCDRWIYSLAAEYSSATLDTLGVPHFLDQTKVALKTGHFNTLSATSTKLGLYTVLFVSAGWCWLMGRSFSSTIAIMLGSSVGLLLTRYLAILVVSYGALNYGSDWTSSGRMHYLISAGSFAGCLLLGVLVDRLIEALFQPIPSTNSEHITVFATANALLSWPKQSTVDSDELESVEEFRLFKQRLESWRASWYVMDWNRSIVFKLAVFACALFCITCTVPMLYGALKIGFSAPDETAVELNLLEMSQVIRADLLPTEIDRFFFSSFSSPSQSQNADSQAAQGPFVVRWTYLWQEFLVHVELRAPVASWQAPLESLESKAQKQEVGFRQSEGKNSWGWYDCRQTNVLGGDSYLFQCCLADDLTVPNINEESQQNRWPIFSKLENASAPKRHLYDIRVYCETGNPLELEGLNELRAFFQAARQSLQSKLSPGQLRLSQVTKS